MALSRPIAGGPKDKSCSAKIENTLIEQGDVLMQDLTPLFERYLSAP